MSVQIIHNPRCSKSRSTMDILNEKGVSLEVVEYLKEFPSAEELHAILKKLGLPATDLIRFKEAEAKELGIRSQDEKSDSEWISILTEHPKLLERPIVIKGDRAVIGRPPENVLQLL